MSIRRLYTTTLFAVICLTATAYNDHRNARVDSLEAALRSLNPPNGDDLLRAYDELMRGYLPFDKKKAEDYGRKALALSYERNGLNVRQDILRRFGLLHYGREEFDEAIRYYRQALSVVDSMTHDKRYDERTTDDCYSCLYGNIANAYNLQDKHHLAIHYYQLALPIFEKHQWLESQAILYYNIGELYQTMGNQTEAERNYLLSIERGETSKDSMMVAIPRKGLTRLYLKQGNYEKARKTAELCYGYYHAHRDEEVEDYPVVLASMVRLNLMEGHQNLAAAKAFAQEALNLTDSMRFENQSDVYAAAAELAMAEKQWQQALDYGLRTIRPDSLATGADATCYRLLAEIYAELGQKEKVREYIGKMNDVMARYATDHYQSGLSQMEVLYETEKKEAQIAALDKERNLYFWLTAAATALMTMLAVLFVYRHVAHRRQKALLAAKVALETETKERRILARDLHDGLGGMLSVLRMKLEVANQGDRSRDSLQRSDHGPVPLIATPLIALLDDIIVELRRTAHHLMPEELLKNGLESALRDFAVSVPNARFQAIGNIRLGKDQELVLYRCAYELVNNALKHADATKIDIQLMQDAHEVTLTVSDNGKGMAEADEGMGLQNIRERIAPYKGQMNIISSGLTRTDTESPEESVKVRCPNQGTEINVTIPL